jgi:AcrR family transcriptional regulator
MMLVVKKRGYHHGDLRRALLEEAVRIISRKGVDGLTLRSVGERPGVSRTAMYRHFADKSALLAAVASEGFRMLRLQLLDAWEQHGRSLDAFAEMGRAYVGFAVANPAHYRVMFGGRVEAGGDPDLAREGAGAFQVLVDAIIALQKNGTVRAENPLRFAQFIWATVHGVAMLAIDGLLERQQTDTDALVRFANEQIRISISVKLLVS